MKVWEKIMLYPIGLCYWIADSAKKTGNFIGRKAKPAIAMLVAVTMMLSLMPITAFAVSSDIIVGGANLGDGSTTVYYKNGDTSGNLTGTAEDYNAKLETVGGVATLTIKNLSVAKTADAGIKSYVSLNLVLEGASSIAEKDDDESDCRGIFVNGDLTISGDGVLSVTAGDAAEDDSYGIYVNGNLTIKSGTINATGGTASGSSYGIYATTVLIHDGTVNATGGTAGSTSDNVSCGIGGSYGVVIYGGTVNATGGAASGSSYGIYATSAVLIEDGTVNATGGTASSAEGNVSCGISAWDGALISGGIVNATGGAAYSSYGIEICYEISGGTVVATGGDAVDDSFGITRGTSDTKFNGGVVVMRGGTVSDSTGSSNAYYSFGIDSISLDGTKLAGQVVYGAFTGSPESYNKNATALAIVPSSYTVQNTKLTDGNTTDYTIDTNTAVVTPGTSSNGVPLNLTEAGSTITLNGDLVLINLLGEWVTPAFSFSGSSASPAKVTGSGTLTAIGAAKSDGNSYGISASGNSYLTVDGVDVIAIGGTASNKSYGIGAAANVTVSNGGSVVAIGGTASSKSYGIGSYNLSVSDTGKITAIGGAVGDSAFSYGIDTYKASISDTAEVTAVGGTGGSMSASYGVGCSNAVSTDSITVAGGTLNAVAGKTGGNSYGINNAAGTVEIGKNSTGGTVTAIGGAAATFSSGVRGGTVMVGSGALNAVGGITNHTSYGIELKIALKVSGGTVEAVGEDCGIDGQYGQGVTISGGTVTAVGGSVGLISSSSGSLAGGSFTGGEMAVFCQNGVNALLASGYSYFAGDNHLTPADSDATVGEANQTVTVKEAPIPHKHCVCGGTGAAGDHTSCEDITWTEWDGTVTFPGGNVYLTDDITLTEALTISGTVNLCLNGHKVSAEGGYFDVSGTLNLCSCVAGGSIIRTSTTEALISADAGATANLYNVTLDGGAVWEGTTDTVLKRGTTNSNSDITSSAPLIYAGGQRTAGGHITLGSGVVLQNNVCTDAGDGGAVTIGEDGTLVINGATICNNAKTDGNAGAIKAYAGAQITLNSGEIYGNEAYKHGGAVQIFGGDSTDYATAVFTMNGGTIRNNKADGVGGGVAVSNYSSFTMNGGTIKDNATTDYSKRGGGVGFADVNTEMAISGNAIITDNAANSTANNLYIGVNSCNTVTVGEMKNGANIGVTMKSSFGGVFTNGGADYVDKEYFTSDKPAYIVAADGNNLKLTIPHTHNYTYSATGNIITESCTCGHEETATVSGPTGTIVYDGTEKKGATVSYSTGWLGGTLTVTYQNNINAGQATASITKAGATASVKFTINKAEPDYTLPMGVTATYGDTLEDIKISDWGSGWSWKEPTTSVGDVGTKTFVAVFTPTDTNNYKSIEVDITVTVNHAEPGYNPPTAKQDLVYSGIEKELVNKGTATGGSMQYALGADGTTAPASGWSTYVPVGRDAGTYYVWYKVVGDENHNDVAPACVAVTIAKKQIAKPAADNSTFTYNGNYQTYAMNGDPAFIIENNVQKNAGSYTVTVTLQDTANYEWTDGTTAVLEYTFKIEQKEIGISWSNTALTYNGAAQRPTATATGVVTGEQIALLLSAPETNAGSYTAMVRGIDGETAQNYKLPAGRSTTFTIEQQALTIVWGKSSFTYDGTEKFPAFNVEGIWNADDVQVTKEGAQTNAGEYTAEISGLTGTAADNYKLTGTLAKAFVINKAEQAAPTGLSKTDETISKKADGTISGISSNMEYRKEGEATYEAVNSTVLENLVAGKYYVRYAADNNHNVSSDAEITIGAGRKLTVTVPQNQIGYTLITTTPELDYYGSIRVEFKLLPGYSMTENFEIYNGTEPIWQHFNQQTGILELTFVASDFDLTVAGVADISAPVAEIDIKNNKWTNFWNDITFGLFFNETQDVTITAADAGSGVNTIQYYLAGGELELDEVRAITDWVDYNGTFKIDPNNRYIVYAKVTDNTGNILYINSDGIVLDNIAPTLEGIENGKTYYGDLTVIKSDEQFYDIRVVTLDGEEMGFAEGTYGLIPADNAEHIVVVEDHAGNKTTYTVTVMKNYTVTYKADGETVSTETVGHGKDATLPAVPAKEGFVGKWDAEGKNITNDTTISVVYTAIPAVKPDEVKPENKSDLEDAKAKLEEMLEDDSYTDNDKKDIQDAIDDIDDALEVIGNVEAVEDLIDKLPENITKNDEDAIKAADDAYNALSDYEKSLVDEDAKKALDDAKAALAELNKPADTDSPQTGDNSNLGLWVFLLVLSCCSMIALIVIDKKRKIAK